MKRRIFVALLSMVLLICMVSVSAAFNDKSQEYSHLTSLLDPATGQYLPVVNVEQEVAKISAAQKKDIVFEQKFEEKRKNSQANQRNKHDTSTTLPVPGGGAGHAYFYYPTFMQSFTNGASISYDILCPTKAGGNVNDFLYLTATNRTKKGVEALILYHGQEDLMFKVFDWSFPDGQNWVVSIPYSEMSNYLKTKTVHGVTYQYVTVQHRTERLTDTTWRNVVWLGTNSNSYYLIHSHDYISSVVEQHTGAGGWGPMVETYQSSYSNLNPMGFDSTYLDGADANDNWGGWNLLSSSQSYITDSNLGLSVLFNDPNYAFVVH